MLLSLATSSALCADVRYVPGQGAQRVSDHEHVKITGEIVAGDTDKLRKALGQLTPDPTHRTNFIVILDSPGGMFLSRWRWGGFFAIRQRGLLLIATEPAAHLAFFSLPAASHEACFRTAAIGLHRPRFDYQPYADLSQEEARAAYSTLVKACLHFMTEMGISDQVFSDMLRVPSQQVRFVNRGYGEKSGLVGDDPAWAEWKRARDVQREGEARIKAQDRLIECCNSGADTTRCDERYKKELREIDKHDADKR